jgi:hypothetical protein
MQATAKNYEIIHKLYEIFAHFKSGL